MIRSGQIVLFPFPRTDQVTGKLRPALVLCQCPGHHDDWLVCMVSTQLHQRIAEMDEVITRGDPDFPQSGLKLASLIRTTRLAVVAGKVFEGELGALPASRIDRIRRRIGRWISAPNR